VLGLGLDHESDVSFLGLDHKSCPWPWLGNEGQVLGLALDSELALVNIPRHLKLECIRSGHEVYSSRVFFIKSLCTVIHFHKTMHYYSVKWSCARRYDRKYYLYYTVKLSRFGATPYHRAALVSVSTALNQSDRHQLILRDHDYGTDVLWTAWRACLLSSFRWYSFSLTRRDGQAELTGVVN